MNYKIAVEKLGTRDSRKIGNNTYLQRRADGTIAVKLHATDVLTFHANGRTVYNSGGWRTNTTRDRMNGWGASGHYVLQEKGSWWIEKYCSILYRDERKASRVGFADGITVGARGKITGGLGEKEGLAERKFSKEVVMYCEEFAAALVAGKVPAPSNRDCWYCSMHEVGTGKPMGDTISDCTHLLNHIKESHFVPSLLANAIESTPNKVSTMVKSWIGEAWFNKERILGGCGSIVQRQVASVLRVYLRRKFGLAGN